MYKYSDLHAYQQKSITLMYESDGILAVLPMGAGKTVIALTAFNELKQANEIRRGLVIANKRIAFSVWPNEPCKWEHIQHLSVVCLAGSKKERYDLLHSDFDLCTVTTNNMGWLYDIIDSWPPDSPIFDMLIVDEASMFKTPKSVRAKTLRKLAKRFKIIWLLTGTPRPNSEADYFVPMSVITRDNLWGKSFYQWREKHFYAVDYKRRQWVAHSHSAIQIKEDVSQHSFSVPLEAIPRPASDPIVHEVCLPNASMAAYKQMEKYLAAEVEGKSIAAFDMAVSVGKLAQITQGFVYDEDKNAIDMNSSKLDMASEIVEQAGGDAILFIYWFQHDLVSLSRLIPNIPVIGSGVSDKEAAGIQNEWNSGNLPYLALQPASGGHGLNLQGTPAQIIHYSLIWSAELYEQAIARVARQGYAGGDCVMNHHIVAKNTIDEMKLLRIKKKISNQEAAVAYLSKIMENDYDGQ